jgi:hypothetical protein
MAVLRSADSRGRLSPHVLFSSHFLFFFVRCPNVVGYAKNGQGVSALAMMLILPSVFAAFVRSGV